MAHCNLVLWSHRPTALASRRKAGVSADSVGVSADSARVSADSAEASPLSLALFIGTRTDKTKV